MRRLVLPDGVWRYRIKSLRFDRDEFYTPIHIELRTPGGREVLVTVEDLGLSKFGSPAVTPGLLREWIERTKP